MQLKNTFYSFEKKKIIKQTCFFKLFYAVECTEKSNGWTQNGSLSIGGYLRGLGGLGPQKSIIAPRKRDSIMSKLT